MRRWRLPYPGWAMLDSMNRERILCSSCIWLANGRKGCGKRKKWYRSWKKKDYFPVTVVIRPHAVLSAPWEVWPSGEWEDINGLHPFISYHEELCLKNGILLHKHFVQWIGVSKNLSQTRQVGSFSNNLGKWEVKL
jgi:hypothetical protein